MDNLLDRIKKTIEEIQQHPWLSVDTLTIQPPIEVERIASIERLSGAPVPENIKQFYLQANGLTCIWRIKPNLGDDIMNKIYETEEQAGYDYQKPLGAIKLLSLQDTLVGDYWKPPQQSESGADPAIALANKEYTRYSLGQLLKPFDIFEVVNDARCMAFFLSPGSPEYKIMMLDDYYADWQSSRITDFESYINIICDARFSIPARKRLFGKPHGDKEPLLTYDSIAKDTITPALFKQDQ